MTPQLLLYALHQISWTAREGTAGDGQSFATLLEANSHVWPIHHQSSRPVAARNVVSCTDMQCCCVKESSAQRFLCSFQACARLVQACDFGRRAPHTHGRDWTTPRLAGELLIYNDSKLRIFLNTPGRCIGEAALLAAIPRSASAQVRSLLKL